LSSSPKKKEASMNDTSWPGSTDVPALASGGDLQIPDGSPQTAADALRRAAARDGRGVRYIDVADEDHFQSYAALLEEALRIAGGLRARGLNRGDPVVFQLDRAGSFIPLLWACLLGGHVAVPVTVASIFSAENANLRKLRNISTALGRPLIVADAAVAEALAGSSDVGLDGSAIALLDELRASAPVPDASTIDPDDTALIFYTSGSTGMPKGVVVTHRNLLAMAAGTAQMNRFDGGDTTLNWMPLDHVGAIVFLSVLPVWLGASQVHVATRLIVERPALWLDLISRHGASISWAPNFAFALVNRCEQELRDLDFDLSSMRFLVNAGEQVAPQTVQAFLEILERYRLPTDALRPAFGMSETCSGITWSSGLTRTHLHQGLTYVSLGRPIPGAQIRITDEQGRLRSEGEIGRLELRGPSVTRGYHDNAEKNSEAFTADGWFRSGDLGFIKGGELHLTGREKEEIVVNGVNLPAHEIEASIETVNGVAVSYTCAIAVTQAGKTTEGLVVTFNPESERSDEWPDVIGRIRRQLAKDMGITPLHVVPLDRQLIPRTAIGKIQRGKLKRMFEDGEFTPLVQQFDRAPDRPARSTADVPLSGIERQIAAIWQSVLELETIGRSDNFFDLGGHSLLLMKVHARLEAQFGPVPLAELFSHPSVAALAQYFGGGELRRQQEIEEEELRRERVTRRRGGDREPGIAVIGMACRLPGADSVEQFWRNLCEGVESIRFFTDSEIAAAGVDPRSTRQPGYVKASPVLSDAAGFDAAFFGFSDKEAETMDPQHRLFLECCWEVMESAGYDPLSYRRSVGLYAGTAMNTYLLNNVLAHRARLDPHDDLRTVTLDSMGGFQLMVANDKDYLTTRISYKLNLRGPSINVQTACSTGLVVIHQAVQSLLAGECDMAIAGTASVQSPQPVGHLYQDGMIVSPDGHCRAFDAEARGTIFGSGVGAVLLKRLAEAQRDGDRILAVVKGSAVNNDGLRKVGYMAPSEAGESEVVREALDVAGVDAATIGFVEAHGTGTELGDPIEVASLTRAFQADTDRRGYCALGSVKTNVGHLQISSGIAGFIKAVLALHHRRIPATLHFKRPNPAIDFERTPFHVNTALMEWPGGDAPRRAGVNSLGIGGTNAHIILEEAPRPVRGTPTFERPWHILALSARAAEALPLLIGRYRAFVEANPSVDLEDLCYTANTGRHAFEHRFAAVFSSREELLAGLAAPAAHARRNAEGGVAFMFTGQGSQYSGMARELYQVEPVFRTALDRCAEILAAELDQPLLEVIGVTGAAASPLDSTACTQPALLAVEYALAQLWLSYGITPAALIGHSVGEYVAACLAGVFTLDEALQLIAARGRLMQSLPQDGAMVAVMADAAQVAAAVATMADRVAIAAFNGPCHTMISGARDAIAALTADFEAQGIETSTLKTSHAFHSPLMRPILDEFRRILERIDLRPPKIALVSNVTGAVETARFTEPDYWVQHIVEPVRFAAGMQTIARELGCNAFLEIGPKPVLLGIVRTGCDDPDGEALLLPSLRPGVPEARQMLESLAELYRHGHQVAWSGLYEPSARQRVGLPHYPFLHKHYWLEPTASSPQAAAAAQPRINQRIQTPGLREILFASTLDPQHIPLLEQHRVFDRIVVAGAGHIATVLAAAMLLTNRDQQAIVAAAFPEALVLPDGESRSVQVQFTPERDGYSFRLIGFDPAEVPSSGDEARYQIHMTGTLADAAGAPPSPLSLDTVRSRCRTEIGHGEIYRRLAARQIDLGPHFSWIHAVWTGDDEGIFEIRQPAGLKADPAFPLHPGLIDSLLQPSLLVLASGRSEDTHVPFAFKAFRCFRRATSFPLWGYVHRRVVGETQEMADITVFDRDGACVAEVQGFEMRTIDSARLLAASGLHDALYEVAWRALPSAEVPAVAGGQRPPPALITSANPGTDIADLLEQVNSTSYRQRSNDLETLGLVFIEELLRGAAALPAAGSFLSEQEIARRIGVAPPFRQLLARLLRVLEQRGRLVRGADGWEGTVCPRLPTRIAQIERVRAGFSEQSDAELTLLCRCGEQLREIMQGDIDPLEVLFPDGDLSLTTRLYQDSAAFRALNIVVADAVETLVRHQPAGLPLRVLEIGAGTGATTHYVLSRLDPERTRYSFTDLSNMFLARAREKFADFHFIDYHLLNIERDPAAQGVDGPFDLVIAANVLHATRHIGETLAHARQLLRPGGHLVMLEVNEPTVPVDLTFGLLEGWWRFADRELRPDYPLLSREQWVTQLKTGGFSEVALSDASIPSPGGLQSVFIARADNRPGPASSLWTILADRGGVGAELARILETRGQHCRLLPEDITSKESAAGALEQALSGELRGVVHLWGLGTAVGASNLRLGSVLDLIHALQKDGKACPLYLVSRGAWPVGIPAAPVAATRPDEAAEPPVQAALWGLGRVLFQEHPELAGALIDVDPNESSASTAAALADALCGDLKETQLALRGTRRFVPRLTKSMLAPRPDAAAIIRTDGNYLITGGLGGLGLRLANELVERGARHITLVGRSVPSAAANAAMAAMARPGLDLQIEQADVTDEAAMGCVIERAAAKVPLRGVFHLAGVLRDGALSMLPQQAFNDLVSAKVSGAWHLDRLTRGLPLDFFVMFSSAAGLLGLPGQGSYAAANAFLDGLAHQRHARGEPALSIDWGRWSEIGMVADAAERLAREGHDAIAPKQGMALLFDLIAADAVQTAVLPMRWDRLLAGLQPTPSLLREIAEAGIAFKRSQQPERILAAGAIDDRPLSPTATREQVQAWLTSQVQQLLGSSTAPEATRSLSELGLDSLMNIDLRNRIARGVGVTLPLGALIDTSIQQLAFELRARVDVVAQIRSHAADQLPAADLELEEEILL
jgi:acyl transferase domain-containing protein/acyl-CoA synthetase (AMP-forming)/AMP-acid ligase II/NAD(P)-dependent dehydrogenase (short-subunit alcohol dehydrogenase family)/phospholipid N-methyltransferase/aryl carrier-like protein